MSYVIAGRFAPFASRRLQSRHQPVFAVPAEQDDLLQLLGRVATGDKAAFASLYDATSSMVFGMVAATTGDRSRASEVTLDIYVEAWVTAPSFDASQQTPTSWLRAIAARKLALEPVL